MDPTTLVAKFLQRQGRPRSALLSCESLWWKRFWIGENPQGRIGQEGQANWFYRAAA
jgi:hypothetical protein